MALSIRPSCAHQATTRCRAPRIGLVLSALVVLVSLTSTVTAHDNAYPPEITAPAALDFAATELVVDTRVPDATEGAALHVLLNDEQDLRRRKTEEDDVETDSDAETTSTKSTKSEKEPTKTTSHEGSKATKTVTDDPSGPLTTGSASATSAAAAATSALPSAFDMTPSSDFQGDGDDDSCPNFVSNFLASPTYRDCYPFSMMLQTSSGLFDAEKQLTSIVRVLDTACAADVDLCTEFFDEAAHNLTAEANCKKEYEDGLTLVTQLYVGLKSYAMLYSATCLQDPDTDMYCFASAVTNTTSPSDSYLYFMPLGLALPGGSTPSCGYCTMETMGIFHTGSGDRSQPIVDVYEEASQQVNTVCGPDAVNGTLAEEISAAAAFMPAPFMLMSILAGMLLNFVL